MYITLWQAILLALLLTSLSWRLDTLEKPLRDKKRREKEAREREAEFQKAAVEKQRMTEWNAEEELAKEIKAFEAAEALGIDTSRWPKTRITPRSLKP